MTKKPETVKEEDLIKRKDGLYYKKHARVPFTGTSKQFHTNGQLKQKGNYINGEYRLYEQFHKNGQLETKENYKNGERHGPYEIFHENGQLWARGNNTDGERDGLWETFDEDGNLTETSTWENGELVE